MIAKQVRLEVGLFCPVCSRETINFSLLSLFRLKAVALVMQSCKYPTWCPLCDSLPSRTNFQSRIQRRTLSSMPDLVSCCRMTLWRPWNRLFSHPQLDFVVLLAVPKGGGGVSKINFHVLGWFVFSGPFLVVYEKNTAICTFSDHYYCFEPAFVIVGIYKRSVRTICQVKMFTTELNRWTRSVSADQLRK